MTILSQALFLLIDSQSALMTLWLGLLFHSGTISVPPPLDGHSVLLTLCLLIRESLITSYTRLHLGQKVSFQPSFVSVRPSRPSAARVFTSPPLMLPYRSLVMGNGYVLSNLLHHVILRSHLHRYTSSVKAK